MIERCTKCFHRMSGNEDKDAEREFFHDQFASGLSYSAIITARSALSIII